MGIFSDVIDEHALTDGLTKVGNILLNRLKDEILDKKRLEVKLTISVEVVDWNGEKNAG